MNTKISRRSFLKGTAAGALSLAASGLLGTAAFADDAAADSASVPVEGYMCATDWLGQAPVIPESDIAEVYETDVVVCGSGHAGSQAALAAAQEGAGVIVLEQQEESSFSCFGDDICSYNSEYLTARGFGGYNLEDITNEFVRRGAGRVSAEIIRKFVVNSGEMLDNMVSVVPETSNVFDFDDNQCQVQIAYECPDASYYPIDRSGYKAWASTIQTIGNKNATPVCGREGVSRLTELELYIQDAAKKLGAEWFFGTSAVVLVQNDAGDVTGVIAQKSDGTYIQINAAKGVILATGDFSRNEEMVYNLLTDVNEVSMRGGAQPSQMTGMGRTGDGHKMGCWAGGMIESQPRPSMNTNGGNPGPWGTTPFLWINARGKRFMNECLAGYAKPTIIKQPVGIVASICDANYMDSIKVSGLDHGAPNWGQAGVNLGFMDRLQSEMDAVYGTGAEGANVGGVAIINVTMQMGSTVYAADTIEELLGYLGYEGADLEQAVATIEKYNEMCEAGVDSQFGKDSILMKPIKTPPFYGSASKNTGIASAGLVTLAGLYTDENMNVLKMDRETPIKGLYACGNCLGQRFGIGYATPSAGASMGMAMTHGRVCGKIVGSL